MEVYDADGTATEISGIPDDARDIIFHGAMDGYNMCSYVDRQNIVNVVAGCRHFNLRQALSHWEGRFERGEIFAVCQMLEKVAERRGWEIGHVGPATITTTYEEIAELKTFFSDADNDAESEFGRLFLELLNGAEPMVKQEKQGPADQGTTMPQQGRTQPRQEPSRRIVGA